jgi:hypothetical protein
MQAATCLQCTRIFLGPFIDDQALPAHLDALLGTPCRGSGAPPAWSPTQGSDETMLELPLWARR